MRASFAAFAVACALVLVTAPLTGCGQRGPLFMPDEKKEPASVPAKAGEETKEEKEEKEKKEEQGTEEVQPPGHEPTPGAAP
jgi:predicted small lipoprotein YifL